MLYDAGHKSWLHQVNPSLKLFLMTTGLIVVLMIQNINTMFPLTAVLLLFLLAGSGQPLNRILLLLTPFLFVFVSTSASMIMFGQGTTLWWSWGPVAITLESFYRGLHVGFRALCFGLMGLLFVLTTRPVLLFYSLMQQLNLPPKYAYGFMAAIRMLPLIGQEFTSLRKAYKVRGAASSASWSGVIQNIQRYSIPLLAQSIRRAQRIAVAMEARRFDEQAERTYYYSLGFSKLDALMIICWIAIFAGAWLLGTHYPVVGIKDVRMR